MGYIIGFVLLVVVVPLLFVFLSRRQRGAGPLVGRHSGGVTPTRPSSDQPTPGAGTVNQAAPGAERRLPPG